jgi:UDP-N-acetylmuramyl pentapeptide phosphotransferase/UDP-N-acetylglucosamine-1-phosphate transferase
VTRTDIAWLDGMLAFPGVALFLTMLVVAGFINSVNIIDGFHGLASGAVIVMLLGIAALAWSSNDALVVRMCIFTAIATFGFALWNWPFGKIFLGDGGAYLIGFWVAELSIIITSRHSEISKWFPLLLCSYPVLETLFTIYRRIWIRRSSPILPDAAHLHQMIHKRIVRWFVGSADPLHLLIRNSLSAPYLWGLTLLSVIPAVLFWNNAWILRFLTLIFAITYVYLYRRIVTFKTPNFLITRNKSAN